MQYRRPLVTQETQIRSLGCEDPLKKEMAAHSSILAWRIPWTEKPAGYSSWGCKASDTTETKPPPPLSLCSLGVRSTGPLSSIFTEKATCSLKGRPQFRAPESTMTGCNRVLKLPPNVLSNHWDDCPFLPYPWI